MDSTFSIVSLFRPLFLQDHSFDVVEDYLSALDGIKASDFPEIVEKYFSPEVRVTVGPATA